VELTGTDDSVSQKTPEEMAILQQVSEACGRPVEELVKVWREPSFSIANIVSSGAVNKTVIPRKVSADISIRIVPDQVSCPGIVHPKLTYRTSKRSRARLSTSVKPHTLRSARPTSLRCVSIGSDASREAVG